MRKAERFCKAAYAAARTAYLEVCANHCLPGSEERPNCRAVRDALEASHKAAAEVCGYDNVDRLLPWVHSSRINAPGGHPGGHHYLASGSAVVAMEAGFMLEEKNQNV